jgi:ligand-binding sensor domain-containing protein
MKEFLSIILFVSIGILPLFSQSNSNWINYSFSKRVSGIDIHDNYVWISTQGGLVRYDKTTGEKTYFNTANISLPENNLLSLYCNSNGDIWVGCKYYGIGKYDGEKCTTYNMSNSGLPSDQYNTQIKTDKDGNVWIISFCWMAKFDGVNWKTWKTGRDSSSWPLITGFDIDNNGVVWLSSTDGFGKIENDEYTIISAIGQGLIGSGGCVKVDNNQNVWFVNGSKGLCKYDGSTFTSYNTSNSCLPTNSIASIAFDSQNNMWLGTSTGLVKFNNNECSSFNAPKPDNSLFRIKADKNDTIWCGTISGNLLCFDGTKFTTIELSNAPLKDNYIWDILIDDDNSAWVATKKNLVKKTNTEFLSIFEGSVPLLSNYITALAKDNTGAVWAAFGSGDTSLIKMGSGGNSVIDTANSPFISDKSFIYRMVFDKYNNLWISSKHGLYKYDGLAFTNYNTENSEIPSNEIFKVVFDKDNNLWGGSANGLFKFDGTNWVIWNTSNSTIPTNVVIGLAFDSTKNLWFSCMDQDRIVGQRYGGGLTSFDGIKMTTFTMDNSGLPANTIQDICIDSNDKLWLGTYGGGLVSFDKKSKWKTYNVTNSGIASNIVQRIALDKNGSFWLGHTDAGISVFNPDINLQSINSIDENNAELSLFPNPVNEDLNIKFKTYSQNVIHTSLYDLTGRLIHDFPAQKVEYNNSSLHYNLSGLLTANQFYIISIKGNRNKVSAKFLYVGK